MSLLGLLFFVLLPMWGASAIWGEPICSPDDHRAKGWDYEEIRIENLEECKNTDMDYNQGNQ